MEALGAAVLGAEPKGVMVVAITVTTIMMAEMCLVFSPESN